MRPHGARDGGGGRRGVSAAMGSAILLSLLVISFLSLSSAEAATVYYLKPDTGVDTNNGLSTSTPWKTMHKVKTTVVAGDVVNVLQGSSGAFTPPSQYQGEGGLPAWTQAQSKGTALGAGGGPITIQAMVGHTPVFDGAGQNYWMQFTTNGAYAGHYVIVKGLTFQNYKGSVIGIFGDGSANAAHHVVVEGNTFQNIILGTNGAVTAATPASAVLIKNNRFTNIGNPALSGGDTNYNSQHPIYIGSLTSNIVIEGNTVENSSGYGVHLFPNFSGTPITQLIVRRNLIVNVSFANLLANGGTFNNLYTYHNTLYNDAAPYASINSNTADALMKYNNVNNFGSGVTKNNIGFGKVAIAPSWLGAGAASGTYVMDYNLWGNTTTPAKVYYKENLTTYYDLAGYQTLSDDEDHSAVTTNPLFTNPAAGTRDFTLQSTSPAKNAGQALTTAVGAGTASTALTVADAGYFYDGFGLVTGDVIQVGSSVTTVTAVNYSTKVLTISPAISWANGALVSLPYSGSAPDIGAFEFDETPPPAPMGGGLDLDGVDDYLDMSTTTAYQFPNTSFTVTGYFKANNDDGYVFARRIISGGNGGYFLRINSTGTATARLVDTNGNVAAEVITSTTTWKDGQKHCFAIVFTTNTTTAAANAVTIYLDGGLEGTATGISPYATNSNKWVAGTVSDLDPSGWLAGGVDDLRIWQGGFTQAQAQRYCAAKIHYFSMPQASVSYWPLDNCAEGASGGGVVFPDRMKGGSSATGVLGGNGTGLTCHGSNLMNYPASVD